jgi:hypothetical protein
MTNSANRPVPLGRIIDGIPRALPAAMRAELPSLAEEIISEIRRVIPEYARSMEGPYGEAFSTGVRQSLKTFVDLVADPSAPKDGRDAMCRLLGEFEAKEGRTLDDLQTAYRIGCQVAWRRLAKVVLRAKLPSHVMAALADAVFSYADELAAVSAEGYRNAQQRSGTARQQFRARLLRMILSESGLSPDVMDDLAKRADWPLPETVTLVAVRPSANPSGTGETSHADCAEGSVSHIDDDILFDLGGSRPHLLIPGPIPETRLAVLAAALRSYRIVIGLTVPLDLAADSLRWAERALSLADSGVIESAPVIRCEAHLVELWLLSDQKLADQIMRRQMSVLDHIPANERKWLIDTFEPWLERRQTVTGIAEALGVHAQTVRYRIKQLKEIFGDRIDDADQRLTLELALRVMRLQKRWGADGALTAPAEPPAS